MSDKNISVITPCLTDNGNNLRVSRSNDSVQTSIVTYTDSDKFILVNKDGGVPDIELDKETVELIVKAKEMNDVLSDIVSFFKDNPCYNNDILNDKKVITTILNSYVAATTNTGAKPDIEAIAKQSIDIQRYRV